MAVSPIKTTPLSWGSLMARGNREPIDDSTLNNSYAHLLWELNQPNTYLPNTVKDNKGGSGNFYVGLITSVPYAGGDKNQYASFTENTNDMRGPWYVSYCDTDEPQGTGKFAFAGHGSKGNPNTYYADRIVLKREMDYALQRSSVSPLQLGTYYTGVGMWYDSYMQSFQYTDGNQELPDGTYFPTVSYAEIFNDYKHNTAYGSYSHVEGGKNYTGIYATYAHAEGQNTYANGRASHAEGEYTYANGLASHAEGKNTYANGDLSHAQNEYTFAGGRASSAIGNKTYANGANSFTSGTYTIANHDSEVSIGKYNKTYTDAIFNIGIGTSDLDRKNAVDVRTTGVAYFHQSAYVYDPTVVNLKKQYPNTYDNFGDESQVVSMSYWQISYNVTYDLIKAKTDGIPDSVRSIDKFDTSFQDKNVLHYTTQHFDGDRTWIQNANNTVVLPVANNDNGDNPRRTDFATGATATAGLMSAIDKARLDDIWTGDKPIVPISIKTGTWTVYKNDGTTTYTLADIKNQSNSVSSCAVEYGFKVKWSGTWQYSKPCGTNDNYKAADNTSGTFGTTLPSSTAAGSTGDTFTSEILGPNAGTVASQKIVAAKKGLVIAEFPSSVSVGNPVHSGRIVPATGNDETSTSVTWGTYRLYFYGQVDTLNPTMDMMKSLTIGSGQQNGKGWTIQYTADTTHCFAIAYPSTWGKISTIKKNGVEIITTSFLFIGEFDYTNGAGYTQKYYIYRSGMGTANMSITVN